MPLLNINAYPPALIRETFSVLDGITPKIAEDLASHMEKSGPIDNQESLMEILSELGVQSRFLPALNAAIAVLPPLPLPPFFPFPLPDNAAKDEFFEEDGENITPGKQGEKDKVCCKWKYRVSAAKTLASYGGNVPGFGRIELAPKSNSGELSVVEGSAGWCCRNTSPEGCRPKPFDLDFDLPPGAKVGDVSYKFTAAANAILKQIKKVGVVLTQPTLKVTPDIRLTPTDGGACYLAKVIVRLEFTKGKVTISAKGITLLELDIGTDIQDTFVLSYKLCCCRIEANLGLVMATDKNVKANPVAPEDAIAAEACACGCRFSHVSSRQANPKAGVNWTTKALEGGCRLERVTVTDAGGQRGVGRNRKGAAITPVMRNASGTKKP